jgi:FkbM family methyltransferase
MSLTLQESPTLAPILAGADLKLVDIGGRGSALPQLLPLAPFASYFACEPDREEAERLKEQLPKEVAWRSVTVMTEAIASREGDAPLYLTAAPGMSSLLEPDPIVAGRFSLEGKFKVERTTTVPTIPLDTAASRYGFEDACFLKLDTQGTELDILQSGPQLTRSLVGLYVESLFHPFYKGQSLFADVDMHLRQHGFGLFALYRSMMRRAGFRADLYSHRVVTWAHCLYLREPDTAIANSGDDAARGVARLLAIAFAFQQNDLVFEILRVAAERSLFPEETLATARVEVERLMKKQTRRAARHAERQGLDPRSVLERSSRDSRYRE